MRVMTPITENFVFAATGTSIDHRVDENGEFSRFLIKTPTFTNDVTTKLQLIDPGGTVVWDSSEEISFHSAAAIGLQARSTTLRYALDEPAAIHRTYVLRCIISGVAGAGGGTVKVVLSVNADKG